MDFSWMPYFGGSWIFPLLCLLFMALMVFGCFTMLSRGGCGCSRHKAPQDASSGSKPRGA
jgi:hypothetical protein